MNMQFKKSTLLLLAAVIVIILAVCMNPVKACTGFGVYGDTVYYGMNFDYPDRELNFIIYHNQGKKIFHMQFRNGGQFLSTCGMNDKGIFCSIQEQHPLIYSNTLKQENDLYAGELYNYALTGFNDLSSLLPILETVRMVYHPSLSLHLLLCDKQGDAFTAEVSESANAITHKQDDFIVMTNFRNASFANVPYNEVVGVGAARYQTAYSYITQHVQDFDHTHGLEVLERTAQTSGSYQTQCSMLFAPQEMVIYIALQHDFSKIWKLSMLDETIETYAGFGSHRKISIDANGVTTTELVSVSAVDNDQHAIPDAIHLYQNYPNPFNPATTIRYSLQEAGQVSLEVYNLNGQKIVTLVKGLQPAGEHAMTWQPQGLSSGIYLAKLCVGSHVQTIKLVLEK